MRATRGEEEKKRKKGGRNLRSRTWHSCWQVFTSQVISRFALGSAERISSLNIWHDINIILRSTRKKENFWTLDEMVWHDINTIKSPSIYSFKCRILSKASKCLPTQRVSYLLAPQSTNNCTRNCIVVHFISCRISSSIYTLAPLVQIVRNREIFKVWSNRAEHWTRRREQVRFHQRYRGFSRLLLRNLICTTGKKVTGSRDKRTMIQ